jgi:hypothetical protein
MLAVAYPLSLGPVVWWRARHPAYNDPHNPDLIALAVALVYYPLVTVLGYLPEIGHKTGNWYLSIGMPVGVNAYGMPDEPDAQIAPGLYVCIHFKTLDGRTVADFITWTARWAR